MLRRLVLGNALEALFHASSKLTLKERCVAFPRNSETSTWSFYRLSVELMAIKVGVIVNSGVQAVESSDLLVDLLHFNSAVEFDSSDDLSQVIEAPEIAPVIPGQLEP